jgi:hypothetical protein
MNSLTLSDPGYADGSTGVFLQPYLFIQILDLDLQNFTTNAW